MNALRNVRQKLCAVAAVAAAAVLVTGATAAWYCALSPMDVVVKFMILTMAAAAIVINSTNPISGFIIIIAIFFKLNRNGKM